MQRIITKDFNLTYTLESGAFFRYYNQKDHYVVITQNYLIKIKQHNNNLYYEGCSEDFLKTFFRLDFSLENIDGFKKFAQLRKIYEEFKGLRLIKQDIWECTLSYMLSVNSSIKMIQKNLEWLSQKYGGKINNNFYSLPTPQKLKKGRIFTRIFGLRAKFLRRLPDSFIAIKNKLHGNLTYQQKKDLLLGIYGVGDKVAECILLYSLNENNAFPVDRWIARFLIKYFDLNMKSSKDIRKWAQDKFGENCGWVQQYLYLFARKYKIGI